MPGLGLIWLIPLLVIALLLLAAPIAIITLLVIRRKPR